jgi:hypothetical protein
MDKQDLSTQHSPAIIPPTQAQPPAESSPLCQDQPPAEAPSHSPANGSPAAAADASQANPPPAPQTAPGATQGTPRPAPTFNDDEAWRRNRRRPESLHRFIQPKPAAPPEPAPLPTALRVDFRFKVTGGAEKITDFASSLQLPLALEPACLAHTDASFGELLRRGIIEPLEIKVRQYIQRRFEEANAADEVDTRSSSSGPIESRDKREFSAFVEEFFASEKERQNPPPLDDFPDRLPEPPSRKSYAAATK